MPHVKHGEREAFTDQGDDRDGEDLIGRGLLRVHHIELFELQQVEGGGNGQDGYPQSDPGPDIEGVGEGPEGEGTKDIRQRHVHGPCSSSSSLTTWP